MQVQPLELALSSLLPPDPPRAKGDHVSSIIKHLAQTLDRKAYSQPVTESTRVLWEAGFLLEDVLSQAFARRLTLRRQQWRLPQTTWTKDGITGTPDLLDTDPALPEWEVSEFKFTRYSLYPISSVKFLPYIWQVKCYCHMIGTHTANLYVLHINGDYRGSGPIFRAWKLRFTDAELRNNWRMMLSARRDLHSLRRVK